MSHYTTDENKLIKKLNNKGWSVYEIVYQLHQAGTERTALAIRAKISTDESCGYDGAKRFITKEALDWYRKHHDSSLQVASRLELAEPESTLTTGRRPKTSSREILGFSKKHHNEPSPTYTVLLLRTQKQRPEALTLFQDLLGRAVAEGRTAHDMLEELKAANQ